MNTLIRTIIVDDESKSRVVLSTLLKRHFPQIDIVAEAASAQEAFELISSLKPRLIFLDIQMPRADGFSLLKRFDPVPFETVFVTSFDQYAISAIKFSALDYLLKPVEISELTEAVNKAIDRVNAQRGNKTQIVNLLRSIDDLPETHHVAIHTHDSVRLIEETSIVSVSADGHYCIIQTENNEKFTTAKILRDFEEYFGENSSFIRIGKSQMINAKKILKYSKGEPCIIEMVNGQAFEVPRRRKPEVLAKIVRYK
jgi:two-component system LytT family response regulator